MIKRDDQPMVIVRQSGATVIAYATECSCRRFKPIAVTCRGEAMEMCDSCHSLWKCE